MTDPDFAPSRRVFMTGAAIALAAGRGQAQQVPATPVGRPQPKLEKAPALPPAQRLGWAIVGLGDFAQAHVLPALTQARRAKPVALVSGNADKARRVAAQYGIGANALYSYDTMARLSGNKAVDVVYIVTPNSTHADLVVKAFEAGKHVMCEKPMATSAADCQRMIDAGRAAGRKLMIAYRAHWEPHNVRAKQMLDTGELGQVRFASSDHHRPIEPDLPRDQWRLKKAVAGGGSLVDIGIYSLNGLIWFFGESPVAVSASTFSPPGDARFAEVEDILTAQLVFPSGRRATISSGYTADKKRIDLWGDKRVATLDPGTAYSGNRLTVSNADASEEVIPKGNDADQFTGEIDHLCQMIAENGPVATPGEMGLRDMRIIEALYRAADERRWVELNPDMTMKG